MIKQLTIQLTHLICNCKTASNYKWCLLHNINHDEICLKVWCASCKTERDFPAHVLIASIVSDSSEKEPDLNLN